MSNKKMDKERKIQEVRIKPDDPIYIQALVMLREGVPPMKVRAYVNSHESDVPGVNWDYSYNTMRQWKDKVPDEYQEYIKKKYDEDDEVNQEASIDLEKVGQLKPDPVIFDVFKMIAETYRKIM